MSSETEQQAELDLSPIRASVDVPLAQEEAFELFTTHMGTWWPLAGHSIGESAVTGIGFDEQEGGRVFEIWKTGEEKDWARVLAWDPPNRVTLSWQPRLEPGTPTEVDVTFTPSGSGTKVEVVHSGWDRVEENRRAMRSDYLPGWGYVLGAYESGARTS